MRSEAAYALREIEAMRTFVLDTEVNIASYEVMAERYPRVIELLRETYPTLPILVVSKASYAKELLLDDLKEQRLRNKTLQREIVEHFRMRGDRYLSFHTTLSLSAICLGR